MTMVTFKKWLRELKSFLAYTFKEKEKTLGDYLQDWLKENKY